MNSVPDRRPEFLRVIRSYWDADNPHSFDQLTKKLETFVEKVEKARMEALAQKSFDYVEQTLILNGFVEEVREVEDALKKAHSVNSSGCIVAEKDRTPFQGDFFSFSRRLETMTALIDQIYKDNLFPYLRMVKNGEAKWHPNGYLCQVSDWYAWTRVRNAKIILWREFPRTVKVLDQKKPSTL